MFDPTIGCWLSEDPEGFEAADPNLYRYCDNNPTNLVDPSGLFGQRWQSAGPCYPPSNSCAPVVLDPNTPLPRHDYVVPTRAGNVDLSFRNFTPADSEKFAKIVQTIRNNLVTAINDLSNFTPQQYMSPSGTAEEKQRQQELREHLDRWFLGYQDNRKVGVSDIVNWVKRCFRKSLAVWTGI